MGLPTVTQRPVGVDGTREMRAAVFHGPGDIRVERVEKPRPGPGEAVIRVTLTTICGTDVHILNGEYPVKPGLIVGHEPVGVIEELGPASPATRSAIAFSSARSRRAASATPACRASSRSAAMAAGYEAIGGWRFGNTINGAQAEYLLVPYAQANLAKIPDVADRRAGRPARRHRVDGLLRRRVGRRADRRHRRRLRAGADRAVRDGGREADGRGAWSSASTATPNRAGRRPDAWVPTSSSTPAQVDVVAEVKRLTGGVGADVAIEALGLQHDIRERAAQRSARAASLSSLGVYSGKLEIPYEAFAAGLGDHTIVTTLCPGGKERMGRLMRMVETGRFDPLPLITHRFALDDIGEAYDLFSNRKDNVLKVAIRP